MINKHVITDQLTYVFVFGNLQKNVDKTISATSQLAFAYRNFTTVMGCMCNKYSESEYLRKIQDEARAIFVSFCDAPTIDEESQREGSVEGPPAIGECQDLNTDVMKEAIADLQSAHADFQIVNRRTKQATTVMLLHLAPHFHFINQIVKIKFREPHQLLTPAYY